MQDILDIGCYIHNGELILIPNSYSPDGMVIEELPPERVSLDNDPFLIGETVIRAAKRCRGVVNEPPTLAKDVLMKLGFKSERDLHKQVRAVTITRRDGRPQFSVLPTKREKTWFLHTDVEFFAPIEDPTEIGKAVRKAVELST